MAGKPSVSKTRPRGVPYEYNLCVLHGAPSQFIQVEAIEKDEEYEDPMANITYPDVDRLSFWGVPYQFDYVFGPGTEQEQARLLCRIQRALGSGQVRGQVEQPQLKLAASSFVVLRPPTVSCRLERE